MFFLLTNNLRRTPIFSRPVFEKVAQIFRLNREAETTEPLMRQLWNSAGFFCGR
jgi:hypothetical protein